MHYIITFQNTNLAIKSERILLGEEIEVTVMPLPQKIRAGCGIALRVCSDAISVALERLDQSDIEYEAYTKTDNQFERYK